MISKSFRITLAIVLAIAFAIPISACQSTSSESTAATYRWDDFDDGSSVLDLSAPYIPANASEFALNIILEEGKLAAEVSPEQLSLAGAIEGWQVESVQRVDDVTLAVNVTNPDAGSTNGAAIAEFALDADAVTIEAEGVDAEEIFAEDASTEEDSSTEAAEEEMTSEEINKELGVEFPTDDDSIIIVNADVETEVDESDIDEDAEDEGLPESYIVAAVFANPYLELDEDSLSLAGNKLTFKMEAADFTLDGRCSAQDLRVVDASGEASSAATVESASVSGSNQIEVTLALASADPSSLDGHFIALSASANETGAEVDGAIGVPDPYLSLEMDYKDDSNAVFVATLNNTDDKLSTSDVKVMVDGTQIQDATVEQGEDSTYKVTVPASAVQSDSVVEVQAGTIKDYAGTEVSDVAAATIAEDAEESRDITDDLVTGIAKEALSSLAEIGWNGLRGKTYATSSSIRDAKLDDALSKLTNVESQLNGVNQRLKTLCDTVASGQDTEVVNVANSLISEICYQEVILDGHLKKFYEAEDNDEREAIAKDVYEKNRQLVDNLAINLGKLHDKILKASAQSDADLIQTYDNMCALTYNWAAQTYESRQQFREEIASVWVNGAETIDLVYGYAVPDGQKVTLDLFDTMTSDVNTLVNTTHSIDETCYRKTSGSDTAYYNYTTGKWFTTTLGTASGKGWDHGCLKFIKGKRYYHHVQVSTPFTDYYVEIGHYKARKNALSTSGTYASTAEVQAMTSRLRNGDTLEDELKKVGLTHAKYLITSESLDGWHSYWYTVNDWFMDTFEVALTTKAGGGFTSHKQHLEGRIGRHKHSGRIVWHSEPSELFVLKYVTF